MFPSLNLLISQMKLKDVSEIRRLNLAHGYLDIRNIRCKDHIHEPNKGPNKNL